MFHKCNHLPVLEYGDEISFGEDPFKWMKKFDSFAAKINHHKCSPRCLSKKDKYDTTRCNPLIIPFKYGFYRVALKNRHFLEIAKANKEYEGGVKIAYVSPCNKILASPSAVQEYLQVVQLDIGIDHFTFSHHFIVRKITIRDALSYFPDISNGKELQPISCVNQVEKHSFDFNFLYVQKRLFHQDIEVNLTEFVVSCECADDCASNLENCLCRSLTQTENCGLGNGYEFKRLMTKHMFGIFECNQRCKCSAKCHNRVMQNGMKCQLQVFATQRKGWGVRALHFIPKGTFVCAYSGQILTDEEANKAAVDHFLAGLDHIEVALDHASPDQLSPEKRLDTSKSLNLGRIELFGQDSPYVIDGSRYSNVGRIFNHACSPNMFTQNIFIETHDLRFTHIGFFTFCDIPAFQELTWDYNMKNTEESTVYCNCHGLCCKFRLR